MKKLYVALIVLGLSSFIPITVFCQAGLQQGEKIESYRANTGNGFDVGTKSSSALGQLEAISGMKVNVPAVNQARAVPSSTRSSSAATSANLNSFIAGALLQGFMNSLFSGASNNNQAELDAQQQAAALAAQQAAKEAAEQQRIKEQIAQAEYEEMMKSYKQLDDSHNLQMKTLNSTNLEYKTLDSNAEPPSTHRVLDYIEPGKPTQFFGDVMPVDNLQILVNIENDPNVVDLRDAKEFNDEKIKNDSLNIVASLKAGEPAGNGEPIIEKPDCLNLRKKLNGYVDQRNKFQKTITLADNQLSIWEEANRNALVNAAKDGAEYFLGQIFEHLSKRGEAADRLQKIYNSKLKEMTAEGVDVAALQAKIDRCRNLSSIGKKAEVANSLNDWQTFIKDGMSALLNQLSGSNDELKGILKDPATQKYFTSEAPELNTLLDISKLAASNMVFGKWVAKKIPVIAIIEISIKQTYNGLDWYLSYKRIIEAQKIKGGVMEVARNFQNNIDATYSALSECPEK